MGTLGVVVPTKITFSDFDFSCLGVIAYLRGTLGLAQWQKAFALSGGSPGFNLCCLGIKAGHGSKR